MSETPQEVTLLPDRLETLEDLDQLTSRVYESHASYEGFLRETLQAEEDASEFGSTDAPQAWIIGAGLSLVGRAQAANVWLEKDPGRPIIRLLRGWNERALHHFDQAVEQFNLAADEGVDRVRCLLEIAETHLDAGRPDDAQKLLDGIDAPSQYKAHLLYLRGVLLASAHQYPEASQVLQQAIELDPHFPKAQFKLAYLLDLHGDEQEAMELYQKCTSTPPVHVNALINLAILMKDRGEWDDAEQCLQSVLDTDPNHPRARLFLRDVTSSRTMIYDEDHEKSIESRNALLDLPISEFELSVRSRNCLKRMQINTLGDLLRTSEAELLAYKNFGETSLNEISNMLSQKGLRLGQMAHDAPEGEPPLVAGPATEYTPPGSAAILNKPVSEIELSVRSRKCLQRLGIASLGELASRTEAELLGSKNFGITSLAEIKQRLAEYGISLRRLEE